MAGRAAPREPLPSSSYRCACGCGGSCLCSPLCVALLIQLRNINGNETNSCPSPPPPTPPSHSYRRLGVKAAPLHDFYPPHMTAAFVAALGRFERQLPGFVW